MPIVQTRARSDDRGEYILRGVEHRTGAISDEPSDSVTLAPVALR